MSFPRKFGDKHGKKLMDTATKRRKGAEKAASKRVVEKTAEATRDLIGSKIADTITSAVKIRTKEKENETNKRQQIYIAREKRQQIINDLKLF